MDLPGEHPCGSGAEGVEKTSCKILLVDDEREYVETLSERLQLRNMNAQAVYDGRQALEAIAGEEPQVVVLDLRMPGMDGIEVLKIIRRSHPLIRVIILTGHGSDEDRDQCMSLGAAAFLQKPVDLEELAFAMRQAVDPGANG